ncbi:MAG: trypsin-like peptidase domain-containing protein [Lachnospiraceae bacterium]|nr:trypsin-like peptidase domain-containing protein [Lachnospiraceae bacterium]
MYNDYNNGRNDNSRFTSDSTGSYNNSSTNVGSSGNDNANRYDEYRFNAADMNRGGNSPRRNKKGGFGKKVLGAIALGLIFGACAGAGLYATNLFTQSKSVSKLEQPAVTDNDGNSNAVVATTSGNTAKSVATTSAVTSNTTVGDVAAVAESVMPSIVAITNDFTQTTTTQDFFGRQYQVQQENSSAGSGIIIGENGTELLVATNQHVVSSADKLKVQFIDGATVEASLKGADEEADLAVIAVSLDSISDNTIKNIKIATLGDSDSLKVGQQVVAIGNALGYGQSVTQGVVSAVNRELKLDNGTHKLIQTDAAINPGNSGGALLDMNGNVIGINEAKLAETGVEGMGYSIPISSARPIIEELMNQSTKSKTANEERGYLGVSIADVTSDVAEQYNMPQGIYIAKATEGLAAANAGIKKGDIITSFDGQKVQTAEQLKDIMEYYKVGQQVEVVAMVPRENEYGYEEKTFTVTLTNSEEAAQAEQNQQSAQQGNDQETEGNSYDSGYSEEDILRRFFGMR